MARLPQVNASVLGLVAERVPNETSILSGPVLGQLRRGLRIDDFEPALTEREREVRALMELAALAGRGRLR